MIIVQQGGEYETCYWTGKYWSGYREKAKVYESHQQALDDMNSWSFTPAEIFKNPAVGIYPA